MINRARGPHDWLSLSQRTVFISLAAACVCRFLVAIDAAMVEPACIVDEEPVVGVLDPQPFGPDFPNLDSLAVGEWWKKPGNQPDRTAPRNPGANPPPPLLVPRDQVVAFAVYTHDRGILKVSVQLYPLMPKESRIVRLELRVDGPDGDPEIWKEVSRAEVAYPGWDAHFRIENWDHSQTTAYRIRHGENAVFEGLIRRDPTDKDEIVVASMSCNSSRTGGLRAEIVDHLRQQDPDLLFFAGDQTYRHTEHTAGWIEFGLQFRDILRDRPVICIPDDHDVGHGNLWGENGRKSVIEGDADGGYRYPVDYVNQVQRQQSWHLPDAIDPATVQREISVYFTRMTVGGVDFAILEDRKFKSGPAGKIPQMGPRPDHINDPAYDPSSIDLPGLQLLGERQEKFLSAWSEDWTDAEMKCVLSQTAFCGAVHMHGTENGRLLADLDCNGWPQSGRNRALELIRRAWAPHLCGDQHLAVVVQHGIEEFGDGPFAFTSPALVNTIYGRWWHPDDEQPGANPVPNSPLPWTGEFKDGLGNRITMLAYANPEDIKDEKQRADGYGIARFRKSARTIEFECWPRFRQADGANPKQFPGWPITLHMQQNDGRKIVGYLPSVSLPTAVQPQGQQPAGQQLPQQKSVEVRPVVQVIREDTGEILYTVRSPSERFRPPVYSLGEFTVKIGRDFPSEQVITGVRAEAIEN